MADGKGTNEIAITYVRESAKDILSAAFDELGKRAKPEQGDQPRFFFPNGIELISLTVDVSGVKVEFKVAGEKGIKGLLEIEEIGGEPTAEVAQEVVEEL